MIIVWLVVGVILVRRGGRVSETDADVVRGKPALRCSAFRSCLNAAVDEARCMHDLHFDIFDSFDSFVELRMTAPELKLRFFRLNGNRIGNRIVMTGQF